jgi:uncharacterized protein (TIGR02302 family)
MGCGNRPGLVRVSMTPPDAGLQALARKRRLARLALWWEQAWLAAWPPLGLLGAYGVLALLDVPAMLPAWPRLALALAALAAFAALAWRAVRRIALPTDALADRRLERDTGLRHRPLSVLADTPAQHTDEGAALWRAHLARVAAQAAEMRVAAPKPGLPTRDGRALRGALLLALVAAVVVAGPEAGKRLLRGVTPSLPEGPPAPASVIQAWITPPAYTGVAPVFLRPEQPAVSVPSGSHLVVNVTGGSGEPSLALNGDVTPFHALDAASWQAERDIGTSGTLQVQRRGGDQSWAVTAIPDLPPTAVFSEPPGPARTVRGSTPQVRLPWRASDDYGLASVGIELRLRDRMDAPPIKLPVPLAGTPKTAGGAATQDLSAHPWAGLPVQGRVVARDAPGQAGIGADAEFVLPERPFDNPLARAVLDVRRQLSLTPEERNPAAQLMDVLAEQPKAYDYSAGVALNMRSISALLRRGRGQDAVDEAQARMWELALSLEDGAPDRTARALEEARQAMRDAVEAKPDTPEKQAELEKRIEELREAIQRHMEALQKQAQKDGTEIPLDPNSPAMNQRELDRMAQEMQKSAKEGRMDDAKRQMAELEQLLEQLQNARPESSEAREQRNAERRERGKQQQNAVQDMVRREGALVDRSQSRPNAERRLPSSRDSAQRQSGDPAQRQSGDQAERQPGDPSQQSAGDPSQRPTGGAAQRQTDAKQQRAMRRALGELMQRFGDLTGQVPPSLGEADTAMRDAAQALADGRDDFAGTAQQRAIEALQKGGRDMGQAMARQFGTGEQPGEGEPGEGEGEGEQDANGTGNGNQPGSRQGSNDRSGPDGRTGPSRRQTRRDPLGRELPGGDLSSGDQVRVPDQMEEARTRALQEELRRRGAERTRPQPELDYIDRLLKTY